MDETYAVKWREPDAGTYVGRLELGDDALVLQGRSDGNGVVTRSLAYDELRGVHIGRDEGEKLDGRATLVVERAAGDYLVRSALAQTGVLQELLYRLSELQSTSSRRATVVVPLREGALERVRALVAGGPPFDPNEAGLTRHQLLLTPSEAIFVFEAGSADVLDVLLGQIDLWAAAAAWRDLVAGAPRIAEIAYSWERAAPIPKLGLGL
ncbi:MAG: hypothetical protein ACM33B_05805 [Pseudomonadota bacterium]